MAFEFTHCDCLPTDAADLTTANVSSRQALRSASLLCNSVGCWLYPFATCHDVVF